MSAFVKDIDIDLCDRRADARAVDADKVRAIASSMGDVGQINPVRLRKKADGRYEIVAGVHRVEACRALGLVEVEAIVVESGEVFAELAMIDENLCRADLGPSDRARQTARRKAIYEELHPETQHGGDRTEAPSRQPGDLPPPPPRFTADTAAATGASERTVQRDAERGEKISPDVLELVRGTELDTGTYLDGLKRFAPDQQRMLVERDLEALARREVNGSRAIAARRQEPADSLDYFPTPPWATRALLTDVFVGQLGAPIRGHSVWEPACGEGHISGVLEEYGARVAATDIFDYSVDGRSPPGWKGATDFLDEAQGGSPDWIITNPPFGDLSLAFALKALKLARVGVALFVRQQWLEGIERHNQLFSLYPPTLVAQFAERVPLKKGAWDPDGDTLTAYCWVVWIKSPGVAGLAGGADAGTRLTWIPPGRRAERSRPDDIARFTAHPVLLNSEPASGAGEEADGAGRHDPMDAPSASHRPGPGSAPGVAAYAGDATSPAGPGGEATRSASPSAARLTRAACAPILMARYRSEPTEVLAAETGVPVATLRTWAFRLGLTSKDRIADMARARNTGRATEAVDA